MTTIKELFLKEEERLADNEIRLAMNKHFANLPEYREGDKFGYEIKNGKVNLIGNIRLNIENKTLDENYKLPVSFGQVGELWMSASLLASCEGFPSKIIKQSTDGNSFFWARNHSANGLKDLNIEYINGGVDISLIVEKTPYLKDIHKKIKQIDGDFTINAEYSGPILGLLLIKGVKHFYYDYGVDSPYSEKLKKAIGILNTHKSSSDLLAAQEELIEAGLKEYAKL